MTPLFRCDKCASLFSTPEQAEKCEAQLQPPLDRWLYVGARRPAFGENGVEWGTITAIEPRYTALSPGFPYLEGQLGFHTWSVHTKQDLYGLSHNRDLGEPAWINDPKVFDPRIGWDAFRYSTNGIEDWLDAIVSYGLDSREVAQYHLGNQLLQDALRTRFPEVP